jgi:hypothetical protein
VLVTTRADERLEARVAMRRALPAVTAGSALLRIGPRLLAIHDDAFRATWIEPTTLTCDSWLLWGDGKPLPKARKPDFEAAVVAGHDTVYLLGSGSTDERCRVAQLDLRRRSASVADRTAFYAAIRGALGLAVPNVEGAAVEGERLLLLHRGVGGEPSACLTLVASALTGAPPRVVGTEWFSLGALDSVPLGFTDLAMGPGGRRFFVAAAEDTTDAVADGAVAGSVLGVIGGAAERRCARWTAIRDSAGVPLRHKVEGLALDDDGRGAWLLSDADDPARPSELCRVELAGPWLTD